MMKTEELVSRVLDCGCEVTPNGATLLSLCSMHGAHVKTKVLVDGLRPAPASDDEKARKRWELTLVVTKEIVRKATSMDANTVAQAIDNHVTEIIRRQD